MFLIRFEDGMFKGCPLQGLKVQDLARLTELSNSSKLEVFTVNT